MKILYVITSLRLGGAERLVAEMAGLMSQHGNKIDIFLFDNTPTPLLKSLDKENVDILSGPKGAFQMWNPFHFFRLRKLIKKGNYDIIHTHNSPPQILTAFAGSSLHTRKVTTEHNSTNKRRKYSFLKKFDQLVYKAYDKVICVSKNTRDNLMEDINIDAKKVMVIPNGINLSKFSPDSKPTLSKPVPQINAGDKIILMTGAFRKQKDQPTLIRAMALLPSNYKLWLAGGWHLKEKAELLAQSLGLEHRVSFLGFREDVPALMQIADINVLATHYEGMPLAAIEAMASGKPFIASDVPGVAETASGAAYLVPESDPEALATAIREVLENEILYKQISTKCMQRASSFDILNTVSSHLTLYQNLCK